MRLLVVVESDSHLLLVVLHPGLCIRYITDAAFNKKKELLMDLQ